MNLEIEHGPNDKQKKKLSKNLSGYLWNLYISHYTHAHTYDQIVDKEKTKSTFRWTVDFCSDIVCELETETNFVHNNKP